MSKKYTRKTKKSLRRKSYRKRGAGWSEGPDSVNPGNLIHHQYSGVGKDCPGVPVRDGYISGYVGKGLPGLSGGRRRLRKRRGGQLVVANPDRYPTNGSITPLPGWMSNPSGSGGTVSAPGVPPKPVQNGGRYGFFPGEGPLNPVNGVGITPAPFGRIPCEAGIPNPLNPNPNNIQNITTAPAQPPYMKGGNYFAGQVDAMRYYAPTAGYSHKMETYSAPSPVPGLMLNTPYDAKAFNPACIKTGGASNSVSENSGSFSPLKMNEITTRSDFDGTNGLLPMKFGGRRRTRKSKSRKSRKSKKHSRKH